ncbi:MAG: transporter [Flavobacteriales bacterium]|nr:transporter [Flavobacteriales bacterium]
MKKLTFLFMSVLTMSFVYGQDITDALRYSQDDIQGSARFRALSGAFGALGGDLSAVSLNPAGSAVFTRSYASFSISNLDTKNDSRYFNGFNTTTENKFDINQGGAVFVFANNNSNTPWKKFTISMEYDKTRNFDDQWSAVGTNTNNNSIDLYFLNYADGLRLDEISALPGESISDAYSEIGNFFGFGHQQAFLGFESFILEPDSNDDANTTYFSNLANGTFNQQYTYASTGYNGKITFNAAVQYEDNLYLGINLNSHLINYDRTTLLFESNSNVGSIINDIDFENTLSTIGTGFSFQLGGILKLSNEFRVGLTFDSPVWYSIEEETTQFLSTNGTNGAVVVNPQVVNVFPRYRLQTPAKATGSLAYVFGDQGLISFDYSVKDYSKTKFRPKSDPAFIDQNNIIGSQLTTASTYRIGGEYKYKQFSFRGGYRFEESPYKNEVTVGDLNGYSLGIGFNFGNTKLDLTFDEANRTNKNALYQVGLTDAATVDTKNTNVTLTLGFNL